MLQKVHIILQENFEKSGMLVFMFILFGSIREFSDTFIYLKKFYFEGLNSILYKKQFQIVCGQIFLYVQKTDVYSTVHLSGLNVLFDQINVFKIPEKIIGRASL